jgi:TolB-like protein
MSTAPDIFLSYSREDQATARRFAEALQAAGFSVWWDQALNAGEAFDQVTEKALEDAHAVVVLWSRHSVDSRWVRAEAAHADERTALVPVQIEACSIPVKFRLTQTADLSGWNGNQDEPRWRQFVEGLRKFAGKESINAATPMAAARGSGAPRPRWLMPVIAAAAAVLLVSGVLFWISHRQTGPTTAAAQGQPTTLAVLPFVNLSSDPEQEYFSDGLTEELLNQLAQVPDLQVTARTSSFAFKGKNEDMRVIGEKLGVAHLLEGSVRKSGDDLRITAQLINASTGAHLWSETFDRKLSDIFAVQDEIAKTVAGKLTVALDVGEMSRARGGTTSIEAYDKYLQGQALGRRSGGRDDLVGAAQFYREAVQIDPDFVRAWAALHANLYASLIFLPERVTALRTEMQQVQAQLEKLAPEDWFTRGVRVTQALEEHQWSAANAQIEAARASAATLGYSLPVPANFNYFLYATGRVNEVVSGRSATDADPLSLNASYGRQVALWLAGRFEDAQKEYERSQSLEGDRTQINSLTVLRLLVRRADPAQVEAHFRQHPPDSAFFGRMVSQLLPALRDPQAAVAILRRALTDPEYQSATAMLVLVYWADYFDDRALVLQSLRKTYVDLQGTNLGILWGPWRTQPRATPEFKAILKDLGLADYFRKSGNWGEYCKPIGDTDFECR